MRYVATDDMLKCLHSLARIFADTFDDTTLQAHVGTDMSGMLRAAVDLDLCATHSRCAHDTNSHTAFPHCMPSHIPAPPRHISWPDHAVGHRKYVSGQMTGPLLRIVYALSLADKKTVVLESAACLSDRRLFSVMKHSCNAPGNHTAPFELSVDSGTSRLTGPGYPAIWRLRPSAFWMHQPWMWARLLACCPSA